MFGFFRRSRGSAAPKPAAETPPVGAEPPDEGPGKSWFASSLDLQEGLEVRDADEETTVPIPLGDR